MQKETTWRKKKMWRRSIILVFCLFFCCTMPISNVKAEETSYAGQFSVDFEFGIKGNVKPCQDTPVVVQITSLKQDFTGTMQFLVQTDEYSNSTAYEQSIHLEKQQTSTYQISISKQPYVVSYSFALLDEQDRVVYRNSCSNCTVVNYDVALMGVLTDSESLFSDLDDYVINGTPQLRNQLVYLQAQEMPEQLEQLQQLDYLLLEEEQLEELSQEQLCALQEWIDEGGACIVIQQTQQQGIALMQNDLLQAKIGSLDAAWWKSTGKTQEEAKKQLFSAFPDKLEELLKRVQEDPYHYWTYSFYDGLREAPLVFYLILIAVYILLVGPGLYLFYRKKKKREHFWFAVVGISFVFAVLVLFVSLSNRIEKPVVSTLTVFDNTAQEGAEVYSQVLSPENGTLTVQFEDGIEGVATMDSTSSNLSSGYTDCHIRYEDGSYTYTKNYLNCFDTTSICARLADSEETEGFAVDVDVSGESLSGTITNISGTKLVDIVAYYHGFYYYINRLYDGQTWRLTDNSKRNTLNPLNYEKYFLMDYQRKQSALDSLRPGASDIEDGVYTQYLMQDVGNDIVVFGLDWEYEGNYVNSDVVECDKAVYLQRVSSGAPDTQRYLVAFNTYNAMSEGADWTLGQDGLYYNFENCEVSCTADSNYHPKKLLLTEKLDTQRLAIQLYNYDTNRYDEVFTDGSQEISEEQLTSYMRYGEMKINYVSRNGYVAQSQGNGIKIPRMDLVVEE